METTLVYKDTKSLECIKKSELIKKNKCVFGTHEWAEHSANFIDGCKHDCKYCYSKEMAIRFHRKTPENWKNEEIKVKTFKKRFKKLDGTIMFPSSHDIHPFHLKEAVYFLDKILKEGNNVLIVTKPHFICIKTICEESTEYREKILFRFTIGSSNSEILEFWEPGAPDFLERFASLKWAFNNGFKTSVSCEPMLDNDVEDVVKRVSPFVTDYIWIGKMNFLLRRLKMNGINDEATLQHAEELLKKQSNKNILTLYNILKNNKKVKWKESIKKVVGLTISTEKGLDI